MIPKSTPPKIGPPKLLTKKRWECGRALYTGFLGSSMTPLLAHPTSATNIWTKASEVMKDGIVKKLPDAPKRKDRI